MNRYSKTIASAVLATTAICAIHSSDASARTLDASGHPVADTIHYAFAPNEWALGNSEANATIQNLPLFADVAAAHHRAAELVDCIQLDAAKRDAEFRLTWTTQGMSPHDVDRHERFLAKLKERIVDLEAKQACSNVTLDEAITNVYPTLLAAAKLGDTAATACYASAIAPLPVGKNGPQDIRAYRAIAMGYVDSGFIRGDWKFVEVMTQATGKLGYQSDWFGHLVPPSRELGYRYRKLLRLAAKGDLALDLDDELAELAKSIPPEIVESMDKEAQKDYAAHFAHSPALAQRPVACEMIE